MRPRESGRRRGDTVSSTFDNMVFPEPCVSLRGSFFYGCYYDDYYFFLSWTASASLLSTTVVKRHVTLFLTNICVVETTTVLVHSQSEVWTHLLIPFLLPPLPIDPVDIKYVSKIDAIMHKEKHVQQFRISVL